MSKVKIGLIQTECKLMDIEYNLSMIKRLAIKAKKQGAHIIALPEFSTTGYKLDAMRSHFDKLSQETKNISTNFFKDLAKELSIYIIAGVVANNDDGNITNSALIIDDNGELLGVYNKNFLFGDEKKYFTSDDVFPVFDTKFGRIGVIICYDNNFPEPSRVLALKGAEIIFCLAAWRTQEREIFDLMTMSHACENTVYMCTVNQYKKEDDLFLFGGSLVANPRGEIVAQSKAQGEDIVYCQIDLSSLKEYKEQLPVLNDYRNILKEQK